MGAGKTGANRPGNVLDSSNADPLYLDTSARGDKNQTGSASFAYADKRPSVISDFSVTQEKCRYHELDLPVILEDVFHIGDRRLNCFNNEGHPESSVSSQALTQLKEHFWETELDTEVEWFRRDSSTVIQDRAAAARLEKSCGMLNCHQHLGWFISKANVLGCRSWYSSDSWPELYINSVHTGLSNAEVLYGQNFISFGNTWNLSLGFR